MKFKHLILPLAAILLAACGGSSSTEQPSTSTPPVSGGGTGERAEINGSEIDAIYGSSLYSLIPQIFSDDYEVGDYKSEEYPVDIYVDLFDWSDDDGYAYDDALIAKFGEADEYGDYTVLDGLYIFVYNDSLVDTEYEDLWYINIYSVADEGEPGGGDEDPGEVGDFDEIDGTELDTLYGSALYSRLPKIYSEDYEISSDPSDKYPIDLFVDLYDWSEADALAYDDALFAQFSDPDEDYLYEIEDNLFIYVNNYSFVDESFPDLWFVNIFAEGSEDGEPGGGDTDPEEPANPGETVSVLITNNNDQNGDDIPNGDITSYLTFTDSSVLTVSLDHNSAGNKTIFNNSAKEIRLYGGSGNGAELIIGSTNSVIFTSVTIEMSRNNGLAVNGVDVGSSLTVTQVLPENSTSISLHNIAASNGQVRITSITVTYIVQ